MTKDFNIPFHGIDGKPLGDATIGRQLAIVCFGASALKGTPMTEAQKYMAYTLSMKLADTYPIDISLEEAQLLKQLAADALSAGAYGQVADIIEH